MAAIKSRPVILWASLLALVLLVAAGIAYKTDLLSFDDAVAGEAAADSTAVAIGDGDGEPESEDPAVPVEIAMVERRFVAAFHRAASSIEADRLVEVPCRSAGRIRALAVEEGDWVEAGQVLAELENDRQKVELHRAELGFAEQGRKLERSRKMLAEDLISEEDNDAVRAAHDQAEAECDLARITLEETYVKAPFAGQITNRAVVEGQQVQAGGVAYTLADFTPLRVRVYLPEPVAAKIRVGETVKVETEAHSEDLDATVERISPVVDPGTGTVRVTLRLPDGAEARVGGFVKARLTTDRKRDVLAVPKLALVEEGGLRSVFVAAADTVRKIEITTGLYDETHVEVTGGLEEGWQVVTLGRGGLRTGSRVEVVTGSDLASLASR